MANPSIHDLARFPFGLFDNCSSGLFQYFAYRFCEVVRGKFEWIDAMPRRVIVDAAPMEHTVTVPCQGFGNFPVECGLLAQGIMA